MAAEDAKRWSSILIVGGGYLVFWLLFLLQPSSTLVDDDNQPQNRLVEALVMPARISQVVSVQLDGIPEAIVDKVPLVGGAAIWFVVAYLIGRPFIASTRLRISVAESRALAIVFGLALLSTLTLLVGLAGGLETRVPMLAAVGAAVLPALRWWYRLKNQTESIRPIQSDVSSNVLPKEVFTVWAERLVPLTTILLAISYLFFGAIAPWDFDVLEYHLGAPKEFYQAGEVSFLQHNVYANMALGTEMHALAAMTIVGGASGWWFGAMIGKVVIAGFSLLGAYLLFGYAGRVFGRPNNWIAAGFFLAITGNIHASTTGLVDCVLGVYVLASVIVLEAILSAGKASSSANNSDSIWFSRILFVSVCAFGAFACKYTGLLFCSLPVAGVLAYQVLLRRLPCPAPIFVMALAAGSAMTCGPWLAKNMVFTGNPVYPLASSVFDGIPLDGAERWNRGHMPGGKEGAFTLVEFFLSAKRFILDSPYQNPGVMFCLLASFAVMLRNPASRRSQLATVSNQGKRARNVDPSIDGGATWLWVSSLCVILAIWWIATHRIDRFWFPTMPLIVVLAVKFVGYLYAQHSRGLATAMSLSCLLWGVQVVFSGSGPNDARFLVPQREFYASLYAPTERSSFDVSTTWCNEQFSNSEGKIALIGQAAIFPCTFEYLYATCFDKPPIADDIAGKSPEVQLKTLQQLDISHVVIDWAEINRYRSPGNYGFYEWPQRADIRQLLDEGVVQEVATPFPTSAFQVLKVSDAINALIDE